MYSIYSVFYEKLPHQSELLLPDNTCKMVTFLNPYYIETLKGESELYQKFDYIASDGIIPVVLNRFWRHPKSTRISFDMSSFAKELFEKIEKTDLNIYFIGSEQRYIEKFIFTIKEEYPELNISGFRHGYIKNQFEEVAKAIIRSNPDIVVIGMGAPLQDQFAVYLHDSGFNGTIYTCGGFFHQTTEKINYYPDWVNKFNLRALYRIFQEPYVFKRIVKYYPYFIIRYSLFLWKMR